MQNTLNIDPLLNQHPELKCSVDVNYDNIYQALQEKTLTRILKLFPYPNTNALVTNEIELIKKHISNIKTDFFTVFNSILKPSDYSMILFHFLMDFIENKIVLYKTNYPNDSEFEQKINNFKCEIAYLKHESDKNLPLSVNNFINYLNEKLKNIDQYSISAEEDEIWKKWEQVLATPNALDFYVADLANKVHSTVHNTESNLSFNLSIPQICQAFNALIKRTVSDLPWLFAEVKKLLNPLTRLEPHPIFNNSHHLLHIIDKNYKNFVKGLEQLDSSPVSSYSSLKNFNELVESICVFCGDRVKNHSEAVTTFGSLLSMIKPFELICEYIETIEKIEKKLPDDHIFNLNDYYNRGLCKVRFDTDLHKFETKLTLDQLKKHIQTLKTIQKCTILVNTYLSIPLQNIYILRQHLNEWAKQKSNVEALRKYHQNEKSVDQIASSIEGPKSRKPQRAIRNPKQNIPTAAPKKDPRIINTDEKTLPITLDKLQTVKIPLTSAGQLSVSLKKGFLASENQLNAFPHAKAALRQALMYAEDLQVMQSQSLTNTPETISTSYYLMEQILRYLILTQKTNSDPTVSCDRHNLKALMRELPSNLITNGSIAKTLYLGNYWASYPFEQNTNWVQISQNSKQEIPKPLQEICRSEVHSETLLDYAEQTVCFSNSFVQPSTYSDSQDLVLFDSFQFNLKKLNQCTLRCEKALALMNLRTSHPELNLNVLKQAQYGLKNLKEIFEKINAGQIRSDNLSFFVRRAIYWQNHVLESLLRIISLLQSRTDIPQHDLIQGYKTIHWNAKNNSNDLNMLQKDWAGMSKYARYPFESPQAINGTHELILKAELMREAPDYGLGFIPPEKNMASDLNFINIPTSGLKAKEILQQLSSLCDRALTFIDQKALTQIETELG